MNKKQQLILAATASLTLAWAAPSVSVFACSSVEACQLQLETLKQQSAQAQAQLDASKDDLDAAKQRVEQTQNLIFGIDDEINSYDQTIAALEAEIEVLSALVESLQAELAIKDQLLRNRLIDLQMKNKINPYLEFLINSDSLTDFIARNEAIKLLNEYDQELIQEVIAKRQELNTQKEAIQSAQVQTQSLRVAANERREDQSVLLAQLEVEKTNYETIVHANEAHVDDINLSEEVVDEQLAILLAIQEQIRREQEEAANRPKPETPSVPSTPGEEGGNGDNDYTEQVPSHQGFVLPTARGYISCHFMCTDYVNDRGHLGTDIAAATGTPTYAVTDGYVLSAKYGENGGFGNMIVITHMVDGVPMVSVYAHLSSISVSPGQRVSGGEYIGAVGNTGQSTGPHLHLELLYGINYMPALRDERAAYAVNSANYISYPGSW